MQLLHDLTALNIVLIYILNMLALVFKDEEDLFSFSLIRFHVLSFSL